MKRHSAYLAFIPVALSAIGCASTGTEYSIELSESQWHSAEQLVSKDTEQPRESMHAVVAFERVRVIDECVQVNLLVASHSTRPCQLAELLCPFEAGLIGGFYTVAYASATEGPVATRKRGSIPRSARYGNYVQRVEDIGERVFRVTFILGMANALPDGEFVLLDICDSAKHSCEYYWSRVASRGGYATAEIEWPQPLQFRVNRRSIE